MTTPEMEKDPGPAGQGRLSGDQGDGCGRGAHRELQVSHTRRSEGALPHPQLKLVNTVSP